MVSGTVESGSNTDLPIKGLKKNYLSFSEVVAQSIGTIAPSGTTGLVISVVFAIAGNGTWLAYVFATIALLIVAFQVIVFATRVATPGALYVYAGLGLGPFFGVISVIALAKVAVAEAKVLTTDAAILAANKLIELGGSRATLEANGFDRYWRDARTHTVHDPVRWKPFAVGQFYLNGVNPPLHSWI